MKKILLSCVILLFAVFLTGADAQSLKFDTGNTQGVTLGDSMKWDDNHSDHLIINDSNIDDSTDLNLSYPFDNMAMNTGSGSWHGDVNYDEAKLVALGGAGIDNMKEEETFRIPEPASMLLLGVGLIGLAGLKRRFSAKK